jgi:Winged helix DNA-binding domain
MWPVLGRPGAVLADGEIAGTWRPRRSGAKLSPEIETWGKLSRATIGEQAEQLALHRGLQLAEVHLS